MTEQPEKKPSVSPAGERAKGPEKIPAQAPAPDYDIWSMELLTAWAATATDAQRAAAMEYETAHQNRPEVLAALGATPSAPPPKAN